MTRNLGPSPSGRLRPPASATAYRGVAWPRLRRTVVRKPLGGAATFLVIAAIVALAVAVRGGLHQDRAGDRGYRRAPAW